MKYNMRHLRTENEHEEQKPANRKQSAKERSEDMSRTYRKSLRVISQKKRKELELFPTPEQVLFNACTDRHARTVEIDLKGVPSWLYFTGKDAKKVFKQKHTRKQRRECKRLIGVIAEEYHEDVWENSLNYTEDAQDFYRYFSMDPEDDFGHTEQERSNIAFWKEINDETKDHRRNMALGKMCHCDSCCALRQDYYESVELEDRLNDDMSLMDEGDCHPDERWFWESHD